MKNPFKNVRVNELHRGYRYSAELNSSQRKWSDMLRSTEPTGTEIAGRIAGEGMNMLKAALKERGK